MTPKELLAYWRTQVHDTKKPYLWADVEGMTYMNLAYSEWVRRIGGLRDATSDLTQIVLAAGVETFELDRRILRVLNARAPSQARTLRVLNAQAPEALNSPARPGQVRALIFGESENTLRTIDTPTEDLTVQLVVRRLPLEAVTVASDAFEIRDEQVEFLVYGMNERAFLKDDPDTYDKARSERNQMQFRAAAAEAKTASENANHVPQPVAYGGL